MLAAAGEQVHVLRDPTRGGLASTLNEIAAQAAGRHPAGRNAASRSATRCAARAKSWASIRSTWRTRASAWLIVAREAAEPVLAAMRAHPLGREAAIIGEVVAEHPGRVVLRSRIGGQRVVDMLSGEQLPRIC